ncbi:hypothetical protein CGCF415_v003148 [Colletotrichum fructicola]|uniref:Uncharacterized protein n=1 Tax=Colletotrichum fructicola (strain Nara gc5) TaxID=1213859 RepID=A0A7J6JJU0_COLFN|nr:hypothetical protein CFRS1_v002980 [Colletotrichum fructicola]KAF4490678.1 hypothetical protein CGGC5_v002397 [Colletotrichum fructicola Nara gc5]KAI8290377.1 hypothetical protein K4K60_005737 [Colletotrichum sp. SAR11_57]KAF4895213.1 hypothetical protein CGCFRS4_v006077 [Colletotrichum fructicola]KAF4913131.1 hypothetical protein CGCF415_v003148 [Colletotrichum fructicola]
MAGASSNETGEIAAGEGDSAADGSVNLSCVSDASSVTSSPNHHSPQRVSYASGAATLIRNHWKAITRNILAIITMAASIFVMAERSKRGFDDILWRSLWCFSIVWSCLLCFCWSQMLKSPNA